MHIDPSTFQFRSTTFRKLLKDMVDIEVKKKLQKIAEADNPAEAAAEALLAQLEAEKTKLLAQIEETKATSLAQAKAFEATAKSQAEAARVQAEASAQEQLAIVRKALLGNLSLRQIAHQDKDRQKIEDCDDLTTLTVWLTNTLRATTIKEVFQAPKPTPLPVPRKTKKPKK